MLIQSDYHIHAAFYRAKKPGDIPGPRALDQVCAARAAGSSLIGIVEHCNASPRHPFHCLEELSCEYYSDGFDRENVFLGVEADLAEDGSDACTAEGRNHLKLHYVIGSVHLSPTVIPEAADYIKAEYQRISNALKHNSNIDIIGHPFGEGMRWARAGKIENWSWSMIPEQYLNEILHLASESGKALEVNRCNLNDPVYIDFLKKIREEDILFSVGSDAHTTDAVGTAAERTVFLESLHFSEEYHWRPRLPGI